MKRRSLLAGGLASAISRPALARLFGRGGAAGSSPPPTTLALVRTVNNVGSGNLNALGSAFWTVGHPFATGEVPTGSIVTATLGGTAVPVHAIARKLHADGSLAWAQLLVDMSGISIAAAASADLVLTSTTGSWSSTTSRTNADWTGLVDTVEITNLSTTGTPAADMDGAGTWIAAFDGGGTNAIEVYGQGPLGLWVQVVAPFVNGATTHRFLEAVIEYWVCEKADTTLGPVASRGPFIRNIQAFKTNPSQFGYDLSWKRNGSVQRSEIGVPHPSLTIQTLCRIDGQWDWTANDPVVWISQDYTLTRKTKKTPPFADGITYTGDSSIKTSVAITGINTGTGVFTMGDTSSLFGQAQRTNAVDFTAASMPTGLTAGLAYWAVRLSGTTIQLYDTLAHALAAGSTGKVIPSTAGTTVVVRLCLAPTTTGQWVQAMGNPGSQPNISLLTEWGTSYHVANTQAQQRLSRVQAYSFAGIPEWVVGTTTATGKIPWLVNGTPPAGMGAGKSTSFWSGAAGGNYSSDIGGGSGPTVGSPALNGWLPGLAHFPSGPFGVWLMEGGTILRDLLLYNGNRGVANFIYLPSRNMVISGTTYYGQCGWNEVPFSARASAWSLRDVAYAAFAAGQGSDEETYFLTVLQKNCDGFNAYKTFKGADYSAMGLVYYAEQDYPPGTHNIDSSTTENFMQMYMQSAWGFASMLIGDRVTDVNAVADFTAVFLDLLYNSTLSPYFATAYTIGIGASDYNAANPGVYFGTTVSRFGINTAGDNIFFAYANGSADITWSNADPYLTPLVNDKFRPQNYANLQNGTGGVSSAAPTPFSDGTDYFVVAVNSGAKTFQVSATSGGIPITAGATVARSGGFFMPAAQSPPGTGDATGTSTSGDGYPAWQKAGIAIHAVRGATGMSTALTKSRFTGNYNTTCAWGFQGTV